MLIRPIKTRKFLPPKDNLEDLLAPLIPKLKENMIVAITCKVISICEGRCLKKEGVKKEDLAKKESQFYLERSYVPNSWTMHTLTHNILLPTAGIDESNAGEYFILWPKNPQKSAEKIWKILKKKAKLKNLGVVITDSHSVPLRRGLIGISLSHFGFEPFKDYRGETDLFGRKFSISVANFPDSLAAAAVLVMGEGSEQTPVALISELPKTIKFINHPYKPKNPDLTFHVKLEDDLFAPFLKSVPWKKGGKENKH